MGADQLQIRMNRPFSEDELAMRDKFELDKLGIRNVLGQTHYTILNEGSVDSFHEQLEKISTSFAG